MPSWLRRPLRLCCLHPTRSYGNCTRSGLALAEGWRRRERLQHHGELRGQLRGRCDPAAGAHSAPAAGATASLHSAGILRRRLNRKRREQRRSDKHAMWPVARGWAWRTPAAPRCAAPADPTRVHVADSRSQLRSTLRAPNDTRSKCQRQPRAHMPSDTEKEAGGQCSDL